MPSVMHQTFTARLFTSEKKTCFDCHNNIFNLISIPSVLLAYAITTTKSSIDLIHLQNCKQPSNIPVQLCWEKLSFSPILFITRMLLPVPETRYANIKHTS